MTITDTPTTTNPVSAARPATSASATLRAFAIKEIFSGILWIVAGVAITIGTLSLHLPVFFVAFGPVIYGARRMGRGFKLLAQA
jgi:hypothetical protein